MIPKVSEHNRVKDTRIHDKKYYNLVRTYPCCVCGLVPSDAHHLLEDPRPHKERTTPSPEHEGTYKSGDNWLIPLCRPHHHVIHHESGSELACFEDWGVDGMTLAAELWSEYNGSNLPEDT